MEELLSAISTISQHFRIFSRPCPRSPYTLSPPAFLTLVQVISFFYPCPGYQVTRSRLPGPVYQVQFIRLPPAAEEWKWAMWRWAAAPILSAAPNILPPPKPPLPLHDPNWQGTTMREQEKEDQDSPAGCPDCTCVSIFSPAARRGVPRSNLAPPLAPLARSPCN